MPTEGVAEILIYDTGHVLRMRFATWEERKSFMATVPTIEQVERRILDEISALKVRSGEIFEPMRIHMKLQQQGLRAAEINGALQSMGDKGWCENATSPKFLKLTDAGYAAI